MNKRIEELIVQAGNYVNETYTGPVPATFTGNSEWHKEFDKWTQFNEKFAELIVRDCADFVAAGEFGDSGTAKQLIEHFGVEE
jgi:hypothetical protein